jgi:hypothetical protein
MGSGHLNSGGGYVPRDGLPLIKVGDQNSMLLVGSSETFKYFVI